MRLRATSVLGLLLGTFLVSAETCESTAPPPDTCVEGLSLTIGTPQAGAVASGDCALPDGDGHHGDSYAFTLAEQSTVAFNVSGTTETVLRIRDNDKTGEQDVVIRESDMSQYGTFAVLKAGSYTLDIAADEDDASGDYTIGSAIITPPNPGGCLMPPAQFMFATVGITVNGVLTGADCLGSGTAHYDNYNVKFPAGGVRKITVTTSSPTGGAVEVRMADNPATLATNPGARNTAGDIVVQFSPTAAGYYIIGVLGSPGSGTITYTLKIE